MRQDTTKRNRRPDQRIQLLVAANRELQVARRDALDLEILGRVAGELEHLGGEVFEDGGEVDGSFGADARLLPRDGAEVTLYAAAGELLSRFLLVLGFLEGLFWWGRDAF